MSIRVVKAFKPQADSKLGVSYSIKDSLCTITAVDPNGIFASAGLRPDQEVLLINGLNARLSPTDMASLLRSLPGGDVTFVVREPGMTPGGGAAERVMFSLGATGRVAPKQQPGVSGVCAITTDIGNMPQILREKGVAEQEWFQIYAFVGELMAATVKLIAENNTLKNTHFSKPMGGTRWGAMEMASAKADAHTWSKLAARVDSAQQNCALAAMRAEQQANSILAKYGVGVVPVMEVFDMDKLHSKSIATGLEFRLI